MADITKYLQLIKCGLIAKLGQRCENGEGYYCMVQDGDKLVPSIVIIEGNGVLLTPIKSPESGTEKQK